MINLILWLPASVSVAGISEAPHLSSVIATKPNTLVSSPFPISLLSTSILLPSDNSVSDGRRPRSRPAGAPGGNVMIPYAEVALPTSADVLAACLLGRIRDPPPSSCQRSSKLLTTGATCSSQGSVPVNVTPFGGIDGHQKMVNFFTNIFIRNLVSKKRRRMLIAGYDLDMSYITNRLLAMSFPAENVRAVYRNPLWQVKEVLDMRHPGCYKVYNLCIEQSYNPSHFHGRVEAFPFDDNHVPSLLMMKLFCENVHSWLSKDPQNVAVIHCMAGKGRTGLMVCVYLVYMGMAADEALQLYADKRTTNNHGVSIASQRRYVFYWSKILKFLKNAPRGPPNINLPEANSRELHRIRLYDTANVSSVFFVVNELQEVLGQLYQTPVEVARGCCRQIKQGCHRIRSPLYYVSILNNTEEGFEEEEKSSHFVALMDTESSILYKKTCLDYYFEKPPKVSGDIRVSFYEKMIGGRLFYTCFNTAFIQSSLLQMKIKDLDKVGFKGQAFCGSDFCLELLFGPVNVI